MKPEFGIEEKKPVFGAEQNLEEIQQYVLPWLWINNIDIEAVKDLPGNYDLTGNLHVLKVNGERVLCQILVVRDLASIASKEVCRYNIPAHIVNRTTDDNRVKETLKVLEKEKVHILIYIKTGWFFFSSYTSLPVHAWQLTYRKKKDRLDRMYVPMRYLLGKFKRSNEVRQVIMNRNNEDTEG